MNNTPKLRFPEFTGEWEEKKLGECLTLLYGKDWKDKSSTKKLYPVLGTGGVISYIDEFIYDKPCVLIGRKGSINNPVFIDKPFWTVDTQFYSEIHEGYSPKFLYYIFCTENWSKHDESTGVPSLSAKNVENTHKHIPSYSEQQKIADFLSNVDSIITAETKILNTLQKKKKALMQKLFTQQLRFKSDDGTDFPAWEEKKVIDFAKVDTGANNTQDKVEDGPYPFYVRSPIIYRSNKYIFDFPEAVLTVGDGVGTGKVFHYVQGKFDCHQRVYVIHDFENVLGKYFYFYFSEKFYARVKPMSAKNSVDSVRREMITDMKIPIPCKAEQQKIADCLSSMDSLIQTQQKVVTTWQQRKKALLQQMFI